MMSVREKFQNDSRTMTTTIRRPLTTTHLVSSLGRVQAQSPVILSANKASQVTPNEARGRTAGISRNKPFLRLLKPATTRPTTTHRGAVSLAPSSDQVEAYLCSTTRSDHKSSLAHIRQLLLDLREPFMCQYAFGTTAHRNNQSQERLGLIN